MQLDRMQTVRHSFSERPAETLSWEAQTSSTGREEDLGAGQVARRGGSFTADPRRAMTSAPAGSSRGFTLRTDGWVRALRPRLVLNHNYALTVRVVRADLISGLYKAHVCHAFVWQPSVRRPVSKESRAHRKSTLETTHAFSRSLRQPDTPQALPLRSRNGMQL